jgi:hypothetical protein
MSTYRAPLRDMQFVLRELAGLDDVAKLPGFEDTPDVLDAILDEASTFASEVLDPINRSGDVEGCTFYADHVLNQALALHHEIMHGSASVMTLTEEQFDLDRHVLVVA